MNENLYRIMQNTFELPKSLFPKIILNQSNLHL